MKERIQKLIAVSGLCSRRAAEELLRAGRVSVNGAVAALGAVADPAVDLICVDGQPLPAPPEKPTTVLLYKPRGVVTTLSDEKGRRTVAELLPPELGRLYPVGRLDQFSEGLLLMTNDGALANRLTHPSGEIRKTYQLWVSGWHDAALPLLRRPITLDGRPIAPPEVRLVWAGTGNRERAYDAVGSDAHIAPVIASGNDAAAPRRQEASGDASLRGSNSATALLQITIHEGRNRQIRRMAEAAGLKTTRLKRVAEGPLSLGDLRPGQWRILSADELNALHAEK